MTDNSFPSFASRGRLFVAAYIDFCFFSSFLQVLSFYFPASINQFLSQSYGFFVIVIVFFLLQSLWINTLKRPTIGQYALSISINPIEGRSFSNNEFFLVDADIKGREHWVTMLIGVFLINDACRQLFRSMVLSSFPPIFGIELTQIQSAIFSLVLGSFLIILGFNILRLKKWAYLGGIIYFFLVSFGFILGHEKIVAWLITQLSLKQMHDTATVSSIQIKQLSQTIVGAFEYSGLVGVALLELNKKRFK